jgi:hypothetical protein
MALACISNEKWHAVLMIASWDFNLGWGKGVSFMNLRCRINVEEVIKTKNGSLSRVTHFITPLDPIV